MDPPIFIMESMNNGSKQPRSRTRTIDNELTQKEKDGKRVTRERAKKEKKTRKKNSNVAISSAKRHEHRKHFQYAI